MYFKQKDLVNQSYHEHNRNEQSELLQKNQANKKMQFKIFDMNKHYFEQNCAVYTVLDLLNVIDNQYLYTSHVYIGTINSNDDAKQLKNYIVIWETIQKYVYVYNCIIFHCIFCFSIEILKIYKTSCQYIQRY